MLWRTRTRAAVSTATRKTSVTRSGLPEGFGVGDVTAGTEGEGGRAADWNMPSFLSRAGISSLASSVRHPAGTTHRRFEDRVLSTVLDSTCATGPFAAEGYTSATSGRSNPDSSAIVTVKASLRAPAGPCWVTTACG